MRVRTVIGAAWVVLRSSIDYWILASISTWLAALSTLAYQPATALLLQNTPLVENYHPSPFAYFFWALVSLFGFVAIFFQAALVRMVADVALHDQRTPTRSALRHGLERWRSLIGFTVVFWIPTLLFTMLTGAGNANVMQVIMTGNGSRAGVLLITLAFLICGGSILLVFMSLAQPFVLRALVIEELGVKESIIRGVKTLGLRPGVLFRFMGLMALIGVVTTFLINLILTPVAMTIQGPFQPALQACMEQAGALPEGVDIATRCTLQVNASNQAILANVLLVTLRSVPFGLYGAFVSAAFTIFYVRLTQPALDEFARETLTGETVPPARLSLSRPDVCTWEKARQRLLARVDGACQFDAELSADDDIVANLQWRIIDDDDASRLAPLLAAADELLCVRPPIDMVLVTILNSTGDVEGVGVWPRADMASRDLSQFLYETL